MSVDSVLTNLKQKLANFEASTETSEVGTVLAVSDGIAKISGLASCQASEMLTFPGGVTGLALNLEADTIGAVILGDFTQIKEGDTVKRTGKISIGSRWGWCVRPCSRFTSAASRRTR